MKTENIYIGLDFDGTCVTHDYPYIGKDIGSIPVLKRLLKNGHKLILNTMRSGKTLTNAVKWLSDNDINLYGVNVNPTQHNWTKSPKVYAQLYIDDAALGCPVIRNANISDRSFVDWKKVELHLENIGVL